MIYFSKYCTDCMVLVVMVCVTFTHTNMVSFIFMSTGSNYEFQQIT